MAYAKKTEDESQEPGWEDAEEAFSNYKGKWGQEEGKDAKAQTDMSLPGADDCEGSEGETYSKED